VHSFTSNALLFLAIQNIQVWTKRRWALKMAVLIMTRFSLLLLRLHGACRSITRAPSGRWVYMYIHVYMWICGCTYACTYTNIYVRLCVECRSVTRAPSGRCVYVYIHMYMWICGCIYTCRYTNLCMRSSVCYVFFFLCECMHPVVGGVICIYIYRCVHLYVSTNV